MKLKKISTYTLNKCYCIGEISQNSEKSILIASDQIDKCLLFDLNGNFLEEVWDKPGGTMSMVEIPNKPGEFLATHCFYSPDDSKNAKIVHIFKENNAWTSKIIADVPFVHRFNIIQSENTHYLIVCTLKSGHLYDGDWSKKGKVYAIELPNDISVYNSQNLLKLTEIYDGLLKNHGYCLSFDKKYSLISADEGIFKFEPPTSKNKNWTITQLTNYPASDVTECDFDNDGEMELLAISPFHGDEICIFKQIHGKYQQVFSYTCSSSFAHSIWSGKIFNKAVGVIGFRGNARDLVMISYDNEYKVEILDTNVGSANILCFENNKEDFMVSANREIDEIAFYKWIK